VIIIIIVVVIPTLSETASKQVETNSDDGMIMVMIIDAITKVLFSSSLYHYKKCQTALRKIAYKMRSNTRMLLVGGLQGTVVRLVGRIGEVTLRTSLSPVSTRMGDRLPATQANSA